MARKTEWVKAWYTVCPGCGRTTVELVGPWDEPHDAVLGWREGLCENCLGELEEERRAVEDQLKQLDWKGGAA
jgi:predicted Fe-S protein YdhL (DUF1289 family)